MMRAARVSLLLWWAVSLADAGSARVSGSDETAALPVSIRVDPPDVHLATARDYQSLIVQATYSDGTTRDVTDQARMTPSDPALARIEKNFLFPTADGQGQVKVDYAGQSVEVPLVVRDALADRPISFRLDVMPVFMKSGCNMGSCHGAARGKDGFRLSLFGFDPAGDYFRLTREISGRRINLAVPEDSLILAKATGEVPHTGGTRFDRDSPYAATLLRWLQSGAPTDTGEVAQVVAVEIYPPGAVLNGEGETQQIHVRAKYSDGTDRDVTGWAYFMTNNDNVAAIQQNGQVTAAKRGEAFVMARFEAHTVGTHVVVLPRDVPFEWPQIAAHNYVDELVHAKLKKLQIRPSDVCTDQEFLRRATIDITGLLPTVEQYDVFVRNSDPGKREKLVDELLQRKEFVELWVMKWAELLQIRTNQQITYKSVLRYYTWLQDRIAGNIPWDQMVRELLGSSGGTFANAATNYYQNERDTLKVTENVAQVFMGMRIQCAQCHNHPFDRWTMDDYYGFAGFFAQIGRKNGEDPRETIVFNSGRGDVRHPLGNRVMQPKFLGGDVPDVAGKDRRVIMADWLASPENPFFARNLANIVWEHFFGKGIIDPVDDVRVSNPAVNPELLDALGERLTESRYDFRQLVRDICISRTYQLSTRTNATNAEDTRNFSHASLRRMRAEVLLDAISQATDTRDKFPGLPLGSRAVQIADGNTSVYFLTAFGRASRETVCSCEVVTDPNLSQALHLLNGDTIQNKIAQGKLVERFLGEGKTPSQIVREIYVRCLTREPTDEEMSKLNEVLAEEQNDRRVLEDIFWALLNAREFLFNH